MARVKREIRGCIDLGSSYFRLLVAEIEERGGNMAVISSAEDRKYIGWGEELLGGGVISVDRLDKAASLLVELFQEARALGCPAPAVVGTNVLRSAANAGELLSVLWGRSGLRIEVLSARSEGALAFRGACALCDNGGATILVDPGGTSTEISWGKSGIHEGTAGFPIGTHIVASLMRRGCGNVVSGTDEQRTARAASRKVEEYLRGERPQFQPASGSDSLLPASRIRHNILFTGGTAVSLAVLKRFMMDLPAVFEEMEEITSDDLALMSRRLFKSSPERLERRLPLPAERTRLLAPGLVLIRALVRLLGTGAFRVVSHDLRWGVVLSGGKFSGGYLLDEQKGAYSR